MTDWTYDALWQKAKLYAERALEAHRESPIFPFWATLALEFLARATLAKIHPVLLADPRQDGSVLYAFGYPPQEPPKSVPAKTVFKRCQVVVADFTQDEFDFCMSLVERRNEELHSGLPAFDDLPTHLWLAKYFRTCKLLLGFQGRSLVEILGGEEAEAADRMIKAAESQVLAEVKKLIATAKKTFEQLQVDTRAKNRAIGEAKAKEALNELAKLVVCPACGTRAVLNGERIHSTEPRLEGDMLVWEIAVLPTEFRCFACELTLKGHEALHSAELGGQYSVEKTSDPFDYFSPAYEEEYMNE